MVGGQLAGKQLVRRRQRMAKRRRCERRSRCRNTVRFERRGTASKRSSKRALENQRRTPSERPNDAPKCTNLEQVTVCRKGKSDEAKDPGRNNEERGKRSNGKDGKIDR